MGSCCGTPSSSSQTPSFTDPSSVGTSKNNSNEGRIASNGSGFRPHDEEAFPDGQILSEANLRIFTFAELKSATRNFPADSRLGEGGFGTVYKGWLDEKTLNPGKSGSSAVIAVKRLNPDSMQGLEEWQAEINFLGRLSHPNLVRLLGYCWEEKDLLLVYEYMPKGSLENHIFRRGVQPLSWSLRLKIAIGAARGLTFLHTSDRQIIYRDFKASNILLDSNYNAKLSDFGVAKNGPMGGDSHVSTRVIGTSGYAAPEYIATGHLYVKSDVYGFGVVLLEMLTGLRALDTNRPSWEHNLVDWKKPLLSHKKKLHEIMDPRLEEQYPSGAAFEAAQLTLKCLGSNPRGRPSMKEVLRTLERIQATKEKPKDRKTRAVRHANPYQNRSSHHGHQRSPRYPRFDVNGGGARCDQSSPRRARLTAA